MASKHEKDCKSIIDHTGCVSGDLHDVYGGFHALFRFQNGYGASVVSHPYSYGGDRGLFELAVIQWADTEWDLCYKTDITDDVLGYLNRNDVHKLLDRIEKLNVHGKEETNEQSSTQNG